MVQKMDVNRNGNINYSEFIEFLQKLKHFEERREIGDDENQTLNRNDLSMEHESPLNSRKIPSQNLHHKFKFNKTYKQSEFKKKLQKKSTKDHGSTEFKTILRQASSRQNSFGDSLRKFLPSCTSDAELDQNVETALYKLKKLNAVELTNLKDSSDTVFSCASEIGFLGLKSLFEQAHIKLSMSEGLAIFKLIDDNKSHRICQTEFEQFISKLLSEIQIEGEEREVSGMRQTEKDKKMMGTLQKELSKALFNQSSFKGSILKKKSSFGSSHLKQFKNKLGNFASKKLNEMSTINQSSIDIFTELSKLEEKRYQNFKYIFNCPLNALKACLEITRELERSKSVYFTDPEFGPTDTDKYGKQSIYFADTLPGYPQPEDMNWLRLHEIAGQNSKLMSFVIIRSVPFFERWC
jgi:hypothetical protein